MCHAVELVLERTHLIARYGEFLSHFQIIVSVMGTYFHQKHFWPYKLLFTIITITCYQRRWSAAGEVIKAHDSYGNYNCNYNWI